MLISRYLLKNTLYATALITAAVTTVLWLTQSLKVFDLIAGSDAPPGLVLRLTILALPQFLEVILPLALVIAILFVYYKMALDNELAVLRSCGVDQYTLAKPALALAGVMVAVLLSLSTYIAPACVAQMYALRQVIQTQYSAFLLREGVFNTFGDKLTIYLRKRETNGDLTGLLIQDSRDKTNPPITLMAKRGRIVMNNDIPQIVIYDGIRQQMDRGRKSIARLYFSRYALEINGIAGSSGNQRRSIDERTLSDLLNPDARDRGERLNHDVLIAEANGRIVSPFNALGFSLTALVLMLLGPLDRRGQHKKVITAGLLVVALQVLNLSILHAAKKNPSLLILLYVATGFPIVTGLYLLHIRGEQLTIMLTRKWDAWRRQKWEMPAI